MTATKSTYRLLAEKIRTSNTLAQVERAELIDEPPEWFAPRMSVAA